MRKITLILFTLLLHSVIKAQTYTISTIAGTNGYSSSGDGGVATGAQLYTPNQTAIDDTGNVYVADEGNNKIRKINTKGIITTLAGTGTAGYSGDGGQATAAYLNQPSGVAVDKSGNVYIADAANYRIRKVNKAGVISTFAGNGTSGFSGDGGAATAAKLGWPLGVAVDSAGNIYIADNTDMRIRKVNTSNIISTIAGNGTAGYAGDGGAATAAELNYPNVVAFDDSGNIYINDPDNYRVRKINKAGIISTFAGTGTGGYSGDGGAATLAKISPIGICVDRHGNIYASDNSSRRVRMINSAGIISTFAGNGTAGSSGDGGLATAAEITNPVGLASDSSGNIYICDGVGNKVRKVNTNDTISTIAGTGYIQFWGDGGPAIIAELHGPQGIGADNNGNIYIADSKNNRIRKIDSSGIITTIAGNGTAGYSGDGGNALLAELNNPVAVAVDDSGNVLIADNGNGRVRKINLKGIISLVAGYPAGHGNYNGNGGPATAAEIDGITSVCADDSGNIYTTNPNNGWGVLKINTKGIINIIYTNSTVSGAYGVTWDHKGDLYFADWAGSEIDEIKNGDSLKIIAGAAGPGYAGDGGPASAAKFSLPTDASIDNSGNISICDVNNNVIRMISAKGIASTIAGTSNHFSNALQVASGTHGYIYIADRDNNRICRLKMNAPVAYIKTVAPIVCTGAGVMFSDSSTNAPTRWNWSFPGGSPSSSTAQNPIITYATSGTYTAKLVASNFGGSDSITKTFKINVVPNITMAMRPAAGAICKGNKITIYDSLSGADTYIWSPSTGLSATTGGSVLASPTVATTYTITGSATGCSNVIQTAVISINPLPTLTLTPTSVTKCPPDTVSLGVSGASTYAWSPSSGLNMTTGSSISSHINTSTTYTVSGTDSNGCINKATITVGVKGYPTVGGTTSDAFCFGDSGKMSVGGTAISYTWAPSTGLSVTTGANITTYTTASVTYTVSCLGSNGCILPYHIPVTVYPTPVITVSPNPASECSGSPLTLTAVGASTYQWSPSTGLSTTTGASVVSNLTSPVTYTISGTDSHGCINKDSTTVSIITSLTIDVTGDTLICNGNSTWLAANGAINYSWMPSNGLSATNISIVNASPTVTTTYTVIGTNGTCADTITKTITVYPSNGFDLTGNLYVCIDTPAVRTASIQACIFNNRCLPTKGKLKLIIDTAIHITSTTADSIAHISGDTLIWNYDSLSDIGKTNCVTLTGMIDSLPAGDSIFVTELVTPIVGDSIPSNNIVTYWVKPYTYSCVGLPFDPNVKSVLPEGNITATQQLSYTIHFQNTGTAPAKNVIVLDTLSSYVDPTTLKVTSASSSEVTTILPGNIVKFEFDNINLPDTATSKTTSIGVVKYTIMPLSSDVAGDKIKNTAGIYFDATPVVKTNTTVNTITGAPLSVQNMGTILNMACFPNPFTTATTIVFNTNGKHYLELTDLAGRTIRSIQCSGSQYELSGNGLAAGIYFIKAYDEGQKYVAVSKLVVE